MSNAPYRKKNKERHIQRSTFPYRPKQQHVNYWSRHRHTHRYSEHRTIQTTERGFVWKSRIYFFQKIWFASIIYVIKLKKKINKTYHHGYCEGFWNIFLVFSLESNLNHSIKWRELTTNGLKCTDPILFIRKSAWINLA